MYFEGQERVIIGIPKERNDMVRFAVLKEIPLTVVQKEDRKNEVRDTSKGVLQEPE